MIETIRKQLIGEDLSGVTFVRDYLQLQFNPPPIFNVYSHCEVMIGRTNSSFGESSFANALISCIGKVVRDITDNLEEKKLEIELSDDAKIFLHYEALSSELPEAIEYLGRNDLLVIWP